MAGWFKRAIYLTQLWVPYARRPNLISYLFGTIRYVAYVCVSVTVTLGILKLDVRTVVGYVPMLVFVGFFEELFRFSMMVRADRPYRSGLIFTSVVEVVETAGFLTDQILQHQLLFFIGLRLATAVMHFGITLAEAASLKGKGRWRVLIFGVSIVVHILFDCAAWAFMQHG